MPCRDYEEPKTIKASELVNQNNRLSALLCKACGLLAMGDTVLPDDLQEWYNNHLVADRAAAVAQIDEGELKSLTVQPLIDLTNLTGIPIHNLVYSILGHSILGHAGTTHLQNWVLNCELEDFLSYQEIIEGEL